MSENVTTHKDLEHWLDRLMQVHPSAIDLGLERVSAVARRMGVDAPSVPVFTVAGTNGKGSCVAYLEKIYHLAGYKVGAHTSPHLLQYNERIRINLQPASDRSLVSAFEQVDKLREEISLTYFEFGLLAALWLFSRASLDLIILEVGLGGRLDAVNLVDADFALVTSIGLDHQNWLGNTREDIGREKAGIFRPGVAAVCGDENPPESLLKVAAAQASPLHIFGSDFYLRSAADGYTWQARQQRVDKLQWGIKGHKQANNVASVVQICTLAQARLPLSPDQIRAGVKNASLAGRCQQVSTSPDVWLDVAHNPDAAKVLLETMKNEVMSGRIQVVVGMLLDKDAAAIISILDEIAERFIAVDLSADGGFSAMAMAELVRRITGKTALCCSSVAEAAATAAADYRQGDRILITGSFHMVSPALSLNWQRIGMQHD